MGPSVATDGRAPRLGRGPVRTTAALIIGVMRLPRHKVPEPLLPAFLHFDVARTVFLDQVRMELGQKPPFPSRPSRPPFPVVAGQE